MATNHCPRSIPARIVYRTPLYSVIGADQKCDSAAMERSARFVALLLLRHRLASEFSEDRDRLLAGTVEPIDTYAVVGVGIFRYLEHIGRSGVVKFHSQRVRREDVVGDVTAPLSGDAFICRRVGDVCRTSRKQNCNRCKPKIFHGTPGGKSASAICIMTCQCGQTADLQRGAAGRSEHRQATRAFAQGWGSEEIIYYNLRPLVRFRSLLGLIQRNFPFFAGVVLRARLCKDSVGDLEGAVR